MNDIFSDRISDVPKSFIREILRVALEPDIISFAGGLPNRELFPVKELTEATDKVFSVYGSDIFQYSNSEGFIKLREYISQKYSENNIEISPENILITNGAQQGLDLIAKTLVNDKDGIIIEEPGYLGAIQAFSLYKPNFLPVPLHSEGMDLNTFKSHVDKAKLIYTVPNFQNPSGVTYSFENRLEIADIIKNKKIFLIEDNPYGDLRFSGNPQPSFKELLPEQTILLGSFSKIIVPGFRIGWIASSSELFEKLLIAKQASDLHTCHFTQYIIYEYLTNYNILSHIKTIVNAYGEQCKTMISCLEEYFPEEVKFTKPEGGMFLWVELPSYVSAINLFNEAVKEKVVFVPGDPFYVNKSNVNTLRLNFSCVDKSSIKTGIERLAGVMKKII